MKVKIKENIVGLDFSYIKGQTVNIKKEIAEDLINAGYADRVKSKSKSKKSKK